MINRSIFLIVALFICLTAAATDTRPIRPLEEAALYELRDIGFGNIFNLTDPDPCMWEGLNCVAFVDPNIRNVETINWQCPDDNKFNGPIPSALEQFMDIFILRISNCGLNGQLPTNYSSFLDLRLIDYSNNELTGPIPPEIVNTPIIYIDMRNNSLSGITPEFKNSVDMVVFLQDNFLTGINGDWTVFRQRNFSGNCIINPPLTCDPASETNICGPNRPDCNMGECHPLTDYSIHFKKIIAIFYKPLFVVHSHNDGKKHLVTFEPYLAKAINSRRFEGKQENSGNIIYSRNEKRTFSTRKILNNLIWTLKHVEGSNSYNFTAISFLRGFKALISVKACQLSNGNLKLDFYIELKNIYSPHSNRNNLIKRKFIIDFAACEIGNYAPNTNLQSDSFQIRNLHFSQANESAVATLSDGPGVVNQDVPIVFKTKLFRGKGPKSDWSCGKLNTARGRSKYIFRSPSSQTLLSFNDYTKSIIISSSVAPSSRRRSVLMEKMEKDVERAVEREMKDSIENQRKSNNFVTGIVAGSIAFAALCAIIAVVVVRKVRKVENSILPTN